MVLEKLRGLGTEPGSSSPEEFHKLIRDELNEWRSALTAYSALPERMNSSSNV